MNDFSPDTQLLTAAQNLNAQLASVLHALGEDVPDPPPAEDPPPVETDDDDEDAPSGMLLAGGLVAGGLVLGALILND